MSQFLLRRFHYSAQEISFFIAVLAVGFSIGFGFLVNPASKYFNLKKCVIANLWIAALLCLFTAIIRNTALIWIAAVMMGMSVAVLYSLLITLFSNQVNSDEQGWVMGITNSVGALSFGITSFMSGFVADFGPAIPIFLGFVGLGVAAIILHFAQLAKQGG